MFNYKKYLQPAPKPFAYNPPPFVEVGIESGSPSGLPSPNGPFGEGCPCLWEKDDAAATANGIEIDCVFNRPDVLKTIIYPAMAAEGDVNVMEHEVVTLTPYLATIGGDTIGAGYR